MPVDNGTVCSKIILISQKKFPGWGKIIFMTRGNGCAGHMQKKLFTAFLNKKSYPNSH